MRTRDVFFFFCFFFFFFLFFFLVGVQTPLSCLPPPLRSKRSGIDKKRISLLGQGSAGLPVLYAAALDENVRGAAITGAPGDLLGHRGSRDLHASLCDVHAWSVAQIRSRRTWRALVAPRPLVLINAVDHAQRPLDAERATEVFAPAGKIFDIAGARTGLRMVRAIAASDILDQSIARWLRCL